MTSTIIWMIITAVLPAILLIVFMNRLDKYRQDSAIIIDVLKCFGIGVVSALISVYAEQILVELGIVPLSHTTIADCFVSAFVGAALPEEFFKLIAFLCILRWISSYDEYMQGVVYLSSVGLGFAAIENIVYLFTAGTGWISIAIVRALLSIPGHFLFSIFMGYFLSKVRFDFTIYNLLGLIFVPFFFHGLYDTFLMISNLNSDMQIVMFLCVIVLMMVMVVLAKRTIVHLQKIDLEEYVISITPPPAIKQNKANQ